MLDRASEAIDVPDRAALRDAIEATLPAPGAATDGLVPFDDAARTVLQASFGTRADDTEQVTANDLVESLRREGHVPVTGDRPAPEVP